MDYYVPNTLATALDYAQLWPVLPLAGITEEDDCDCGMASARRCGAENGVDPTAVWNLWGESKQNLF